MYEQRHNVAHLFSFFVCYAIICLYVPSSVLRCPLRFPHKYDVRFVFTSSCLLEDSCLIYVICVYLCIVVSDTYCRFFRLCCQFLWIVHFGLPLRYSLTFIYILLIGVNGWGIRIENWMLLITHTLITQKYTCWTEDIKHSTTTIR